LAQVLFILLLLLFTKAYFHFDLASLYGRSHSIKIDNSSFERVEQFQYFGTNLTNQISFQEEMKSRLKSGNACYHSVQILLSSSLVSKNITNKIYRIIILPVVLYGVKLGGPHFGGGT